MARAKKPKVTPTKKLSLAERILKTSNSKFAKPLVSSFLLERAEVYYDTGLPILNLGLSGSFDLGLPAGITTIAAPPKHFKSLYGLYCVESFLKSEPDGVVVFYDTEFGINAEYLERFDLDHSRIIHIPITTAEELRSEISNQLKDLYDDFKSTGKINDKVMFFIDSIGNVPSDKEVTDAENEKATADMTRAKILKSMFRIITTKINMMNIPAVFINHTYQTLEMYSKTIVGGGTGVQYASANILSITKAQETEGSDKKLTGYTFTLVPLMSRYVREKSKIPVQVFFDRGIPKYSGLMDLAKRFNYIEQCKVGVSGGWKFTIDGLPGEEPKEYISKTKEIHDNVEFWEAMFKHTDFKETVHSEFSISQPVEFTDFEIDGEFSKTLDEEIAESEKDLDN